MRQERESQHPSPDPELGAALRSLEGEPPLESVDWESLRRSIGRRAELPLAQRRRPQARPRPRAWRPMIPLAVAASIALAVWMGGGPGASEAPTEEQIAAEEVFHPDLSEQEFRLLVSERADPEALLLIALDEP